MEKSRLKKIGVLGGMGPQATQYFFQKVIEQTDAKTDQEHVDMVIINHASTPDRTATILSGKHADFLSSIEQDIRNLEACAVDYIVIPCNTSHFFYPEIQSKTHIPIVNMIEETIAHIETKIPQLTVGILATDGTIKTRIYQNTCARRDIQTLTPDADDQKILMSIIYDEIKNGKRGDLDTFMAIVSKLISAGCSAVILGCTELSYLKAHYSLPEYCIDPLEILAKKTIELSGRKYRP